LHPAILNQFVFFFDGQADIFWYSFAAEAPQAHPPDTIAAQAPLFEAIQAACAAVSAEAGEVITAKTTRATEHAETSELRLS
jgi:hypothetical protein